MQCYFLRINGYRYALVRNGYDQAYFSLEINSLMNVATAL